ncbi:MAG: V-type ATP synthase subunit I [Negativicutes bacterium]|nr:V-type ATP synthase subunit I [Negativicutes bacterium]
MLVSMKKVTLYALKEDRAAILLNLQRDGNVMLLAQAEGTSIPGTDDLGSRVETAKSAIKFVSMHVGKPLLMAAKTPVTYDEFLRETGEGVALSEQVDSLSEKIASLRNEASTLLAQAEHLHPWLGLDVRLEDLKETGTSTFFAGYLPDTELDKLREELKDLTAEILLLAEAPEGRAMVVFAHKSAAAQVKHILKTTEFIDVIFPKRTGFVREIIAESKKAAAMKETLAHELEIEALEVAKRKSELFLYYDQLAAKQERVKYAGEETEKTFCLQGWVRSDKEDEVSRAVAEATNAYDLNFSEPEEGEIPPTVMQNGKFSTPYEAVTELYSRPRIGSIDPNFMMAPFHFIFFGMMLSDAGYGLILTCLLFIMLKVFKPQETAGKLMTVVFFGSISTVIWGALFGGWFGLEWQPLLFVPMKEPLKMLALCFALGALHLVSGMVMKMYLEIKRGQVWNAVFDQLSWLILFTGLFLMVYLPNSSIGKYTAMASAALIVLTGGREKEGYISKLIAGLLSLYNISSYVSDLLSYSRLFALGLATGVIAVVINTIAQMLSEAGPIGVAAAVVVLIGGHIFNILINVLGSFVHTCRLQYIEFFGKFYEAGGKAFVPLAIRTKYMDVTK